MRRKGGRWANPCSMANSNKATSVGSPVTTISTVGLSDTLGIVAMEEDIQEELPPFSIGVVDDAPSGEKAAFPCFNHEPVDVEPINLHVIFRQGPGLVRANHGCTAERFDGGQVFNQGVAFRHALTCHCERQGHGRKESLGHVGDDDADAENSADPEAQPRSTSQWRKMSRPWPVKSRRRCG